MVESLEFPRMCMVLTFKSCLVGTSLEECKVTKSVKIIDSIYLLIAYCTVLASGLTLGQNVLSDTRFLFFLSCICFSLMGFEVYIPMIYAEIIEDPQFFRPPLLCCGQCIQDLVVCFRCLTDSLFGQCLPQRHHCVHNGALLLALSYYCHIPRMCSLPFDMQPSDPTAP